MENSREFPQKIKSRNQQSHYRLKSVFWKNICTSVFISIFHNCQEMEQPKCPLTDKWINRTRYLHGIEYYSHKRRNPDTCYTMYEPMNLNDMMLSEISHPQKDRYCRFHLYEDSKVVTFIEIERMAVTRLDAGGKGNYCYMVIEFHFCKMKSSGNLF